MSNENFIEQQFAELDKMIDNMQKGIPLERNEEIDRLAKLAVEAKDNDTRTEEEIIASGVAFIMDTRLGGQ